MRPTRPIHRLALTAALALLLTAAALPALAQRGDDGDRVSKNGKTTGTLDGVSITLEYGRPNVKGREIWGGLVPYGKVWRSGANEATTFEVDKNVTVEGEPLAAGKYALFTIPTEGEWTVIFNSVAQQWGAYDYDSGKDVLRVTVKPRAGEHVESMDFVVEGGEVVLRWEKLQVPIAVAAQ